MGQIGVYDFHDPKDRGRAIAFFAWMFPVLWSVIFLFVAKPAFMVIMGGVITTFILVLVVFAAIDFRFRRTIPALRPSIGFDIALGVSIVAILAVAGKAVYSIVVTG